MVAVQFGAGAEVDIASGDDVQSIVNNGVDSLFRRLSPEKGMRLRPIASYNLATPATGTFVLDLGRPAPGTVWLVQEVVVTAADDRTAPAGALASLYCGNAPRQSGVATLLDIPSLGELVRPAIAVPGTFQFGSAQGWPVKDGESLTVVYYSPTTAVSVISAVGTVMQLSASALSIDRLR